MVMLLQIMTAKSRPTLGGPVTMLLSYSLVSCMYYLDTVIYNNRLNRFNIITDSTSLKDMLLDVHICPFRKNSAPPPPRRKIK